MPSLRAIGIHCGCTVNDGTHKIDATFSLLFSLRADTWFFVHFLYYFFLVFCDYVAFDMLCSKLWPDLSKCAQFYGSFHMLWPIRTKCLYWIPYFISYMSFNFCSLSLNFNCYVVFVLFHHFKWFANCVFVLWFHVLLLHCECVQCSYRSVRCWGYKPRLP